MPVDRASDPAGPGRRRRRAWSSSSPLGSESDFNLSYSLRHSWHCQRYSAGESATLSRRRGQPEGHHTLRRVALLELKHASVVPVVSHSCLLPTRTFKLRFHPGRRHGGVSLALR